MSVGSCASGLMSPASRSVIVGARMQLESFRFGKHNKPLCQTANPAADTMTEAAAGASIFAMSFLPVGGRKIDRTRTTIIAKKVGPLCRRCLKDCKELSDR